MAKFNVGDRFKLTGEFLRNTGQVTGPEGLSTWTVVACECAMCTATPQRFVASDEPSYDNPDRPRHFATANLRKVRSRARKGAA